ncbi:MULTISPECIES: hypothetical protein [Nocardiopsis]|uniref:Secreted protein n=1 Tax=Nocardiopsis sinuspersici TaxID=501010 RepID=A0A1V3C4A7_9ACTN|nr:MULTISPECIES: hypothetical protein [Nocardiopsis]OOC55617.1 hypothetical protein NOSIN_18790 [Nocardiopsis sinuspersici]
MNARKLIAGSALAALAALPLLSSSAMAISAYQGDDRAYTNSSGSRISVYDGEDDGRVVYGQYYRQASAGTERGLYNKSGPRTTVTSGSGSDVIKLRVCESISAWPDACSDWKA